MRRKISSHQQKRVRGTQISDFKRPCARPRSVNSVLKLPVNRHAVTVTNCSRHSLESSARMRGHFTLDRTTDCLKPISSSSHGRTLPIQCRNRRRCRAGTSSLIVQQTTLISKCKAQSVHIWACSERSAFRAAAKSDKRSGIHRRTLRNATLHDDLPVTSRP